MKHEYKYVGPKFINFIRLNRGHFFFQGTVLKFGDLLEGLKKCKISAQNYTSKAKKHRDLGVNTSMATSEISS